MEVIDSNLTPLSAFEALELVRQLKLTQDQAYAELEAAIADPASVQSFTHADRQHINPDNVQSLTLPFINHFESEFLPQSRQSTAAILTLLEHLRSRFGQVGGRVNGLTKAERLQICDLAPTEVVEFHLIIEECDSRFTEEEIEEMLSLVKASLLSNRQLTSSNHTNTAKSDRSHQVNGTERFDDNEDYEVNLGDIDDDDALVAEGREDPAPADQELDEVPD
ncbi:hypothetical protein O181_040575 [Austropuccinia psidii MF-1]|uniref:DNA-directed RNA polymerase III subunit RPC9 n=1 Tax=Austropuccinia psidii MF-1 TaxID=1389203 RepID=A0A9Q3HGA1_9BASI|nr:hypothetical protein [Austropuccinia psidii MF-1]